MKSLVGDEGIGGGGMKSLAVGGRMKALAVGGG